MSFFRYIYHLSRWYIIKVLIKYFHLFRGGSRIVNLRSGTKTGQDWTDKWISEF